MEQDSKVINKKEVEKLERIASILKVVAHPLRLGVVHLLEQYEELTVSSICERLDSEQSLTSHHLQTMRLKGILSSRRDGRSIYYSLKEKDVSVVIECLANCQCNM
jgi:ArsR family transcriptional regulator